MISEVIAFVLMIGASKVGAILGPILLLAGAGYLGAALGARHLAWLLVCAAAVWFAAAEVYQAGVSACESRVEAAVAREVRQWSDALTKQIAETSAAARQHEADLDAYGVIVHDLEIAAANKPAASLCPLSDADARRLR